MKIVINTCYGGFHPSPKAIVRWAELSGIELHIVELYTHDTDWKKPRKYRELTLEDISNKNNKFYFVSYTTKPLNPDGTMQDDSHWYYGSEENEYTFRCDPNFIQAVEELGEEAADKTVSEFKIVEIPDDVEWVIEEYDGIEWVSEKHRTWD